MQSVSLSTIRTCWCVCDCATQTQSRTSCLRLKGWKGSVWFCDCVDVCKGYKGLFKVTTLQYFFVHGCYIHTTVLWIYANMWHNTYVKSWTHFKRQKFANLCVDVMHAHKHTRTSADTKQHTNTCVDAKGQITHAHKRRALPHVDVTQWPCCHT